ncbi:MAG TPA: FecR family protein [Verrucomicrobiae bacterium]|nr:FecR family protein [Verrucomicrobiae bacterium]
MNSSAKVALDRAVFTELGGSVWVMEPQSNRRAAVLQEQVGGNALVKTENRSRAEMQFLDHSLMRLGANAVFSFQSGTRVLNLEEGSLFLQVPKGLGVGTKIQTVAATVSITGTTLSISASRSGDFSIVVIEGSVVVRYRDGTVIQCKGGQKTSCDAGKSAGREAAKISAAGFMSSSQLVSGFTRKLPTVKVEECDDNHLATSVAVRDAVKDTTHQIVRDTIRDTTSDTIRDTVRVTVRDNVKDGIKTTTSDTCKDNCKDSVRTTTRTTVRDTCRGPCR